MKAALYLQITFKQSKDKINGCNDITGNCSPAMESRRRKNFLLKFERLHLYHLILIKCLKNFLHERKIAHIYWHGE